MNFATVAFGKIPALDLSEGYAPSAGVTYSIETISGEIPKLSTSLKVFKIGQEESTFSDLERAKIRARAVDFNQQPYEVIGNIAKFRDPQDERRVLEIDIVDGQVKLNSNYLNDPSVIAGRPASLDIVRGLSDGFLSKFDVMLPEFSRAKAEFINYKIDGGKLTPAAALTLSNLVQVNYKREDLNKLPILNPDLKNPNVWTLVSGQQVVAANISPLKIQRNVFATYPAKGTAKAYEELKKGMGAYNKEFLLGRFIIREITLAYLETGKYQAYLQPVYVFKSDEGLVAYVSAIDSAWTNQGLPKSN